MGEEILVNFFTDEVNGAGLPTKLMKELKVVQEIRNTTPTEKVNGKYVGSPTNKALNRYRNLSIRLIGHMVDQGLSFANSDYYVYVQFGGKPSVTKSPNGMIKAVSKLASKAGYIANINSGCIFQDYLELSVTRDGEQDTLHLVNSPEAEIENSRIIAPYAVSTLIRRDTGEVVSRKVIIVRNNEYEAAKQQGGYTHQKYPVPMAQKIALRRMAEEMSASLGLDDSFEYQAVRREIADHDKDYKQEGVDINDLINNGSSVSNDADKVAENIDHPTAS